MPGVVETTNVQPRPLPLRHYIHLRVAKRDVQPGFSGRQRVAEVAAAIGARLPQVFGEWSEPQRIDFSSLPSRFVLKPTCLWSAKGVMVLRRDADGSYFDSMERKGTTEKKIIAKMNTWRDRWQATRSDRSFSVRAEERVTGENGEDQIPFDYKLYVIDGRVRFILQIDRNVKPPAMAFFLNSFEPFDYTSRLETPWSSVQRGSPVVPKCANELVAVAEAAYEYLRTPMISVDLYASANGPVMGELTWAPGGIYRGGMFKLKPDFDAELGRAWFDAINRLGLPHPEPGDWSEDRIIAPPKLISKKRTRSVLEAVRLIVHRITARSPVRNS